MRCEEFERIVFEGGETTADMLEHAKACEACRVLLENADVLCGSAKLDEDMEVPASFSEGWRANVRREAKKGRAPGLMEKAAARLGSLGRPAMTRALAFAACAVVLVGVGALMGRQSGLQGRFSSQKDMVMAYGAAPENRMKSRSVYGAGMETSIAYDSVTLEEETAETAQARKIVRTAQLSLEVEDMDAAIADLQAQVQVLGGEITYCETSGEKGRGRYGSMEASVPTQLLDSFLGTAGGIGKVTREVTQQTDMTAAYYDNASRLESAMAQKQRLDELYASAQDMTDIVTLTDAIFEVQQEIDDLTGQNAWIDSRAEQARVTITLEEPAQEQQEEAPTFLEEIAGSFMDGVGSIGSFFGGVALFAVWALPWCAVIGMVAAAGYAIRRYVKKK